MLGEVDMENFYPYDFKVLNDSFDVIKTYVFTYVSLLKLILKNHDLKPVFSKMTYFSTKRVILN